MSKLNLCVPSQRSWITTSIAWLSMCIIAAAWGNRLLATEYWGDLWGVVGVFGLASALGLASIAAARKSHDQREPKTGD